MTVVSTFASTDAMKRMIDMGMEDGMREAMAQIDGVIADPTAAGRAGEVTLLDRPKANRSIHPSTLAQPVRRPLVGTRRPQAVVASDSTIAVTVLRPSPETSAS